MSTERREFRLDKNAISLLIQAQSGTLQKALLEAVTNALDAGSSQVSIELSSQRVVIEDDGRGFKDKDELGEFFECFGFDHSNLDRTVGRFGVGRGQLFNFGKNLWTTNGFTMAVDARTDPYAYDLGVAAKPHKGVKIEIDLYAPLTFGEMAGVENEFKKLVKYSPIPVLLNGKRINKDAAKVKWDHDTPEAWISLDDSYAIKLYSQGLFVQQIPAYKYGKGGVVVTKMGQAIKQNLARNDTLITECPVWKKVDKTIYRLAKQLKKESPTVRINESMRGSLASSAIYGHDHDAISALLTEQLFTTTNSKHMRLDRVLASGYVAVAPDKDPSSDLLMQRAQAVVLSPRTLSRFDVETLSELVEKTNQAIARYLDLRDPKPDYPTIHALKELQRKMSSCQFFDNAKDLPMRSDIELVEVKTKELSADERVFIGLIRNNVMPGLSEMVWNHLHPENPKGWYDFRGPKNPNTRAVKMAITQGCSACTDGRSTIWIDRKHAQEFMNMGASGFISMTNLMVHELLHDFDSSIGHDHDHDFYQAYHDLTMGPQVGYIGLTAYRSYLTRGGKASSYNIQAMEKAEEFTSQEADERMEALAAKSSTRARMG